VTLNTIGEMLGTSAVRIFGSNSLRLQLCPSINTVCRCSMFQLSHSPFEHDWLVQSDRCGTTQSAQSTFGSHRIQPLYLQALRSPTHCSSWLFPCNAQDVCIAVGCGIGGPDHSRHHYWCTPAGAPRQCRSAPAKACCICQQFLLTAAVDIYQKGIPKR